MTIFTIFGLILIVYAFVNYKKSFILFLIFRLFLNQNINLINLPGIPLLTLEFTLCFLFFCIFLIRQPRLYIDKSKFPLTKPFILIISSCFLSTFFGIAGLSNSIFNFIKVIFENYISIWLIWVLLKEKKDFTFLIRGVTIVCLFAGIYGLYEAFTHTNPLMDYEISIAGTGDRVIDWNYEDDIYRGYRIKSIFIHAIGAGINWGLSSLVIFYLYFFNRGSLFKKYTFFFLTASLLLTCLFFTNSRAPIVFLLIGLIPLINLKKYKSYDLLAFTAIILVGIYFFNSSYFENIFSIFNKHAQENIGGSNFEMRLMQLYAAFQIASAYPILGIGLKGLAYYPNQILVEALLGLESMWFKIIVEQGILGVLTTLYLMYVLIIKLGLKTHNRPVLFLSLAYFITYSMTSVPGFATYLLYTFIFMFYKFNQKSNIENQLRDVVFTRVKE